MTPGAGHCLGNGLGGSGGGGGGVDVEPASTWGAVVKGSDWALLKRAHPVRTSGTVHNATSTLRIGPRSRMPVRLRTLRPGSPRRYFSRPVATPHIGVAKETRKSSVRGLLAFTLAS
jgi:hypothetical protein